MGCIALAVHLLLAGIAGLRGRPFQHTARRFSVLALVALAITFLTGVLIYPAFRVNVRAAWMDANAPLLTGLFEIKENWAALALLLAGAVWWHLRRPTRGEDAPEPAWGGVVFFAALLLAVVMFNVLVGLWLVAERSV